MVTPAAALLPRPAPTVYRAELPAVTGMRFIPPLLGFLIHAMYPLTPSVPAEPAMPFADPRIKTVALWLLDPVGTIGMSFFFVLTGFIVTWSADPAERVKARWRRQLVMLMPTHVVTWLLAMLLFAGAHTPYFGLPNLLLFNAYVPDPALWGGANGPAWRLCVELLFYLLFPLLMVLVGRIAEHRLWAWAGGMVAGMAAVCVLAITVLPDGPLFGQVSLTQFWFVVFFPPVRAFEFVLGMILARIVRSGRWPRIGFGPVTALLALGYAGALVLPNPYDMGLLTVIPISLAIGTVASANLRGVRTAIGCRSMVWLGNLSFGFYMTQALVIFYGRPALLGDTEFGVLGGLLLLVGLFVANVCAGWLLVRFVERPAMRRWARAEPRIEPLVRC